MNDDYANLAHYEAQNEMIIHCIDEDPNSIVKELQDLSQVEKYVMSDQDYQKLPMNVKKFKKMLKINNPELFKKSEVKHKIVTDPDFQKELIENLEVGNRLEVTDGKFRGEIRYIGKVPDLGDGFFVGVALDEPWGDCNGCVNGIKYFESDDKYGVFKRPSDVSVGDFPELDIDEI